MFSFFTPPETHPEAKTMAQYYDDFGAAVKSVKDTVKNFNDDAGFVQAANVIEELVTLCRDMEKVNPLSAKSINEERAKLWKTIGTNGIPNVTGEASKLLAEKYIALLKDVIAKKYWPSADCPSILGQSYLSKYGEGFEDRKKHIQKEIQEIDNRITAYQSPSSLKSRKVVKMQKLKKNPC